MFSSSHYSLVENRRVCEKIILCSLSLFSLVCSLDFTLSQDGKMREVGTVTRTQVDPLPQSSPAPKSAKRFDLVINANERRALYESTGRGHRCSPSPKLFLSIHTTALYYMVFDAIKRI